MYIYLITTWEQNLTVSFILQWAEGSVRVFPWSLRGTQTSRSCGQPDQRLHLPALPLPIHPLPVALQLNARIPARKSCKKSHSHCQSGAKFGKLHEVWSQRGIHELSEWVCGQGDEQYEEFLATNFGELSYNSPVEPVLKTTCAMSSPPPKVHSSL